MLPSYETVANTLYRLVYVLITCLICDIVLIYLIGKYTPWLKNTYFTFHVRHGAIKITALKILGVACLSHLLLHPPLNGGTTTGIVLIYCITIVKLLSDFIRGMHKKP